MQGKLIYGFGPFRLEPAERRLLRQGQPVNLSPQLFSLLLVFVESAGHLVSKEELRKKLWGENHYVDKDALKVIIGNLRKAIGENGEHYIETVRGEGYRFIAPVIMVENPVPAQEARDDQAVNGSSVPINGSSVPSSAAQQESQTPVFQPRHVPHRAWLIASGAVALLALAATVGFFVVSSPPPAITGYHQLTHNGREQDYRLYTDGVHLYFNEWTGKSRIAEVPVAGGETVYLRTPFKDARLLGIFPGGSPQPLPPLPSFDAAISPDGQRIAYTADQAKSLGVMNIDGSDARRSYAVLREDFSQVQWSPDGKLISFNIFDPDSGGGSGTGSAWAIEPDGSNLHRLLPQEIKRSVGTLGRWTPDGKYYVFDSIEDGKADLWVLPKAKDWLPFSRPRITRLTNIPQEFLGPLISADGKKIFARSRQMDGELVRYDMKAGKFVPYLGGISAGSVDFSRDGQWVTYVRHPEGTLWRSRVDGSEIRQLSFAPYFADSPRWSPDGRRIAYRASLDRHARKVYVVSRDGGVSERIIPGDEEIEDGVATWAPDGNSLVFGRLRFHPEKIAIHILNLKTRQVTTVPGSQGLWTPRWSPDGRFLLALTADAENSLSRNILLFDFRLQKWKKLVDHIVNEPVWSHDQRYIYFDQLGTQVQAAIFRVRVSDGRIEQLVALGDFLRAPDRNFGDWFGLAPDDSPLLLREVRKTEIYALDVRW